MYLLGGSESDLPNLDGMDMWSSLSSDKASPRNLMLHNIDESRHIAAVRVGDWKLVKGRKKFVLFCNNAFSDFFSFLNSGTTYHGQWDGWYGPDGRKGRPYNYNLVYNSPAAKGLKSIGMSVPNKSKIDELRSETQLHCEKPKNAGNCDPSFQVCLFNITADPCELNNLAFKVGEMSIVFVKCV